MKQTSITLFILLLVFSLNAQERWQEMIMDSDKTFQQITQEFESHMADKSYVKGQGIKQFQRWENFWQHRLMPDGSFPNLRSYYREILHNDQSKGNETGNWIPLGPYNHETTSSWSSGSGRVNVIKQDPNNSDILFVGTPSGGLWKSVDNGTSWMPFSDALAAIGISDIAIDQSNSDIIYLGTGDRDGGNTFSIGLVKSTDGGLSWNIIGPDMGMINKICIDPNNPQIIWVAGKNGLYKSSDEGYSWEIINGNAVQELAFKPNDSNTIYFTSGNDLYFSNDQGETFTETTGLPQTCGRMVIAVTEANPNVIYVLSANEDYTYQGLYRSNNSGISFELKNDSDPIFDGTTQAWYDMAITVSDSNPNMIITGLLNLWRSTDGGGNFDQLNSWTSPNSESYTHADIHYLSFENDELFCGSDGGIYKSLDNGLSFTDLSQGLSIGQFYSIARTDEDNTLAGGLQDNGSYVKKGDTWKNYIGADGMASGIDPENSDRVFGMIQYGSLYMSEDGGNSISSLGKPADDGNWETPMVMDPSGGRLITGYNELYEYDFETGWNQLSSYSFPEKLSALAMSFSDANVIYASANEKVYKTMDNGITWIDITGNLAGHITSIEIHPDDHDCVWITVGGFSSGNKIYKSISGGSSWSNISGNLPNQPTHVVKYDSTTEGLYIGNDIGVYYLGNSESNWIAFDHNLPTAIVKDIEIDVNTEIIQIATFGRGLWQSELFGVDVKDIDVKIEEIVYPITEVCGELSRIEFVIKNVGSEPVNQLLIEYTFSNGFTGQLSWEGTLNVGQEENILIDGLTINAEISSVFIDLRYPNDVVDEDRSNNEITLDISVNSDGNLGVFLFQSDCYAAENSWKLFDENGSLVDEVFAGELTNNSLMEFEFCLLPGCYELTIYDSYGDGIAGSDATCENDGNYNFSFNGEVAFEMNSPDFGNSVSHGFCVLPNSNMTWDEIPPNVEIECSEEALTDQTGIAFANTNCDISSVTIDYSDQVTSNQITRVWTASDACGTVIYHNQIISLIDTESPSIVCGPDVEMVIDEGGVFVEVDAPLVSDNCGLVSILNDFNQSMMASDYYEVGVTTLNWTAIDNFGNESYCTQQIAIEEGIVSGLVEFGDDEDKFVVYPNPNNGDVLYVKFQNGNNVFEEISIRDLTGRILLKVNGEQKVFSEIIKVQMPQEIANGLYLIDVKTENRVVAKKIIVKR